MRERRVERLFSTMDKLAHLEPPPVMLPFASYISKNTLPRSEHLRYAAAACAFCSLLRR